VSHQEGDEERQGHHHEEWPSGHPGRLPRLRHQNVQDRKVVPITRQAERGWMSFRPLFFFRLHRQAKIARKWFDNLKRSVYIGIIRGKRLPQEKGVLVS